MARRARAASPILGAVAATIEAESRALVTDSGFRHTFEAAVASVEADPDQPRRAFDAAGLQQLAATMEEQGQLQPILVRRHPSQRGHWVIVAGERRWRAAQSLGWRSILAMEHDGDPEVAALLENLQRVDLTVIEEARGIRRLLGSKGWTQSQAADALGRSKGDLSAVLGVMSLPAGFLNEVLTSELNIPRNVLVELARVKDGAELARMIALARAGRLTVRELRQERDGVGGARPRSAGPAVRFSTTVLDRLALRLSEIRKAGKPVTAEDRTRLESLRAEIDALLTR